MNKGFSSFILIIMIIIVLILLGITIYNFNNINSDSVLEKIETYEYELDEYLVKKLLDSKGDFDIKKLNADYNIVTYDGNIIPGESINTIIPSLKEDYSCFYIENGEIKYNDDIITTFND